MVGQAARQLWKRTLSLLKIKLLYSRVTLTRFTTFYFFIALGACIVLSALQAVAFVDNSQAVTILTPLVKNVTMAEVLLLQKGVLQTCTSIPSQAGTVCTVNLVFGKKILKRDGFDTKWARHNDDDDSDAEDEGEDDLDDDDSEFEAVASSTSDNAGLTSNNCMISLSWLQEILEDSKREDVVTFLFQIWLFSLSLVTILNESIPHLGAAFFGHVLGTAWAGYRIQSTHALMDLYRNHIVPEACGGKDVLGSWWDVRIQHAIPIVIINALVLVAFVYVSTKLYKVYATESFGRVGASTTIHRIYKIVLLFSVGLQLSGFFTLASSAMWIDKICHGTMKLMAKHSNLYLAAFITTLVFQFPWLYLGWVCVRRECRIRFGIFCAISAFLLTISTLMFFSPLYRYIFINWPFFATVTVTAYILSVGTSVLAIICRLNFGKGLAHYLQVTEALEGVDFTPVSFWKGDNDDAEKSQLDEKSGNRDGSPKVAVQLPNLARQASARQPHRGSSIYSDSRGNPIMLSSSPPLVSELGPAPPVRRSRSLSRSEIPRKASMMLPPGLNLPSQEKSKSARADASAVAYLATAASSGGAGENPILTRTPIRSSSVSSKASTRRKFQKQGLPTNPRPDGC